MHISIMGASRGVGFQLLKESDIDWIIVRPGFLTNGPRRGRYRAITDLTGVKAGKISRADVAHFILAQLASPTFLRQSLLLTY
jgi:putative NADH-flavin reductase